MAFGEFGLSKALAYRHNWEGDINRSMQNEALDHRARVEAENKARLLSEEYKFGQAVDPYNQQRLKAFNEKQAIEVGNFIAENPDFRRDPGKMARYKNLTSRFTDNDIIRESLATQKEYETMIKYIKDNPESLYDSDMQKQMDSYKRYVQTGNASDDPQIKAGFTFINPIQNLDVNKFWKDRLPQQKERIIDSYLQKTVKEISDEDAYKSAFAGFNGPERFKLKKHFEDLDEITKSIYGAKKDKEGKWIYSEEGIVNYHKDLIKSLGGRDYNLGIHPSLIEQREKARGGRKGGQSYLPWAKHISMLQPGEITQNNPLFDILDKKGSEIVEGGLFKEAIGEDGKPALQEIQGLKGLNIDWEATPMYVKTSNGKLYNKVTASAPLDKRIVHDKNLGLDEKSWFGGMLGYDYQIKEGFTGSAISEDGTKLITTAWKEVIPSEAIKEYYNTQILGVGAAGDVRGVSQNLEDMAKVDQIINQRIASIANEVRIPGQPFSVNKKYLTGTDHTTGKVYKLTSEEIKNLKQQRVL